MRNKIYIVALFALMSCVDSLNVNIDRDEFLLVVEGSLSTEAKEHKIRLTRSAKYGTIFDGAIRPVIAATVVIRDGSGNITELFEKFNGNYFTPPDFKAEVGETYTLQIQTLNGDEYLSYPETVPPAIEIEELVPRFRKFPVPGTDALFTTGVEIYAQFQDPPGEKNYYWWELGGTHFVRTYPENFLLRLPGEAPQPAPKSCCSECWISEGNIDSPIRIASDVLTDGSLSTELAGFIEDNGYRFTEKYLVRVKQYSQSKEAHQFFSLLNDQLNIDGDIFDAPPGQVRGNIYNTGDINENVIGYFWVGDIATDSVFVNRQFLDEPKALKQFDDDCRVLSGSTTQRPSFW